MNQKHPYAHTPIRPHLFIGLFLGVLAFLACTVPENHSEAEDTYYYSRMAEQGEWSEMFHQHHLLYLPLARGVYWVAQSGGLSERALPVLVALSMVAAAGVISLFAAMLRRDGRSPLWVLPLLFSYGFWRYACAAEIYLPALLCVCGAWVFASRPKGLVGAIACSVAALLLHLVCLPAVFAIGLLFAVRKEWKALAFYFLSVGGIVAAVYGVAHATIGTVVFRDASVVGSSIFVASTWLKGVFAFGQNLLSGNFLFSIPAMADRLVALFPSQMLQEELFMGQQAGGLWQAGACITFLSALPLLGVAAIGLVLSRSAWRSPMTVWFAGNIAMALLFEPANPEMWIFTILPFWFLVSNAWKQAEFEPRVFSRHWKILFSSLTVAMLLHNAVGGMAFVQKEEGDYCYQKAEWIIDHAVEGDVIVSADSHSFLTYMQYWSPAQVLDAKFQTSETIFQALEKTKTGRGFVFDDVLNPLPAMRRRVAGSVVRIQTMGNRLQPHLKPIFGKGCWKINEWHFVE